MQTRHVWAMIWWATFLRSVVTDGGARGSQVSRTRKHACWSRGSRTAKARETQVRSTAGSSGRAARTSRELGPDPRMRRAAAVSARSDESQMLRESGWGACRAWSRASWTVVTAVATEAGVGGSGPCSRALGSNAHSCSAIRVHCLRRNPVRGESLHERAEAAVGEEAEAEECSMAAMMGTRSLRSCPTGSAQSLLAVRSSGSIQVPETRSAVPARVEGTLSSTGRSTHTGPVPRRRQALRMTWLSSLVSAWVTLPPPERPRPDRPELEAAVPAASDIWVASARSRG